MGSPEYETLASFFDVLLLDPSEAGFAAAEAEHPDAAAALHGFLRDRFVTGRAAEELEGVEIFWDALAMILARAGDDAQRSMVSEVVLRVAHPEVLRQLAPLLRVAIPPARMEDAIIEALRGGTPVERRNAYELEYYLFQFGGGHYPMSAPGRAEFAHFAAEHAEWVAGDASHA